MKSWRILFATPEGPDSLIVEASSRREAREAFLEAHPELGDGAVTRVVLVPD